MRVAIIAVALLITALVVPGIEVAWGTDGASIGLTLLAVALVFGLVNAFVRPVAGVASIPLNLATLGLFSVVLNATLLLLVAFLVDLAFGPLLVVGGFPPGLDLEAVGVAAVGAFIISAISAALTILIPDA